MYLKAFTKHVTMLSRGCDLVTWGGPMGAVRCCGEVPWVRSGIVTLSSHWLSRGLWHRLCSPDCVQRSSDLGGPAGPGHCSPWSLGESIRSEGSGAICLDSQTETKSQTGRPAPGRGTEVAVSLQLEGERTRGALIKSVTLLSLWWTSALGCCSSMPNGVFFS